MRDKILYSTTMFLLTELLIPVFAFSQGNAEIRDIRPPLEMPANYSLLWLLAIVMAGLLIFFLSKLYKKWKKGKLAQPEIKKTPFEIAYELLEMLRAKNLPSAGKVKQYYSELADIVRKFIEDYFGIRAPEMTTPEFMNYIKQKDNLSRAHKDLLKDFLNSCDMVKFAKYGPTNKEIDKSFDLAKNFIDDIKVLDDQRKQEPEVKKEK